MDELKAHATKYAIKCLQHSDIHSDIYCFRYFVRHNYVIMHSIIVDIREQLNRCDYNLPYVVSN